MTVEGPARWDGLFGRDVDEQAVQFVRPRRHRPPGLDRHGAPPRTGHHPLASRRGLRTIGACRSFRSPRQPPPPASACR